MQLLYWFLCKRLPRDEGFERKGRLNRPIVLRKGQLITKAACCTAALGQQRVALSSRPLCAPPRRALRRRRYVTFALSAPPSHTESIESAQVLSSTVPAGTPASPSLATLSLSHDCGCFPRAFPQSFRRRPVRLPPRQPAHVTCVPPSHGGLTHPSPLRRAARARARDQPPQCSALFTWSFTFIGP